MVREKLRTASILFRAGTRALLRFVVRIKNRIVGYPPPGTDLVGYESLLDWIRGNQIYALTGDVVEIGSFLGGGTAKLARFFGRDGKKVYAVDIFDPSYDNTRTSGGISMQTLYSEVLRGRKQEDIFKQVTRQYSNIVVINEDSKKVKLPCTEICFSFIDGCHDPDYVRNDFYLVWDKTVSGGVVGFHDYETALPQTTRAIDGLIESEKENIRLISRIRDKTIILLTKK